MELDLLCRLDDSVWADERAEEFLLRLPVPINVENLYAREMNVSRMTTKSLSMRMCTK